MTIEETDKPEWTDVAVAYGKEIVISYRSGMVVYEESFQNDRLTGRGWNGTAYINVYAGRVDPDAYPQANAFWLEMDGQFLGGDWEWVGIEQFPDDQPIAAMPRPFALHAVVTLRHRLRPVTVRVHTGLDGTSIIVRWLEIMNTGDAPASVGAAYTWSGIIEQQSRWREHLTPGKSLYSLGYMANDRSCTEGSFHWFDLPDARYAVDGRAFRGQLRHPMFVLRNNATGRHFIGQLAWSGGYSFEFSLDAPPSTSNNDSQLWFRAGLNGPAPQRMLAPGETIATPEMHLGVAHGGLDEAVQAMHDHIRLSVLMPQARGRGGWIESGVGPEVEITADLVMQCIEHAADIGAEVFFIDASWYAPPKAHWWNTVGDWIVNTERFPNGVAPFRERAHALGILFGLWMEPERVGSNCGVASEHPEWLMRDFNGKERGGMLDLTKPEVAEWVENQIERVIVDNDLDFFRLDYNEHGTGRCAIDNFAESHFWRYYDELYAIYDRLRARYPNVIFESCACGGGRTDLGMVRRFAHTWITDWQIAPRSFAITNGMTMALPPECIDRLIFGQSGHRAGDLDFQVRQLLFVRPTIGPEHWQTGPSRNPELRKKVKAAISFYKEFVRPFASTSRIYHHTPVVDGIEPRGWGVIELVSRDRDRGICGLFQLASPDQPEYHLRLRGIDSSRTYNVTFGNSGDTSLIEGFVLAKQGVTIRLEGALSSELVIYESV